MGFAVSLDICIMYVPPPDYCLDSHLIFSNKRDNLILQNEKNNQMITQNKLNIQNAFTFYIRVYERYTRMYLKYDSTYTNRVYEHFLT